MQCSLFCEISTWNSLQRFYRYHELLHEKEQQVKRKQSVNAVSYTPYCAILKQCLPQCFNVFFVFFVTLTIFPAVHSGELPALSAFTSRHKLFCLLFIFSKLYQVGHMEHWGGGGENGFIHSFDWKVHFGVSSWLRNLEGSFTVPRRLHS